MDPQRAAWLRKFSQQREPWHGPVHAAPLFAGLTGRVLELGAGGGKVGAHLPHATAIDWAAIPTGRAGVVADVRALPVRDASVDAIVAIHVLGHLPEPSAALTEWARVLRPRGALVLEVFGRGDARDGAGREVAPHTFEREGIQTRYFAKDDLATMLDAAGFEGEPMPESRHVLWGERRVLRGLFTARDARRDQ